MNKIKVLHYSTHNEDCGIGKYQEQFLRAMEKTPGDGVYNEFFSYSPNVTKGMSFVTFTPILGELKELLKSFDLLHIQHELSFYKHAELRRIVDAAHDVGKKVIITVHTAPDAQYKTPIRHGYGPHSLLHYVREIRAANEFTSVHILPIQKADIILVHNQITKENLIKHGVDATRIKIITLPVPEISVIHESSEIKTALRFKDGDIIIATVGFISKTKGVKSAVRSLKFLPDNYKLALVGGIHPGGGGEEYLDEVCNLIVRLGLKERVYITGYVDDDMRLNSLINECDICIYPYDNNYYKYVSSAALNNAIANHKPAIAYPAESFVEMNILETIAICKSANYYELARYIVEADYKKFAKASKVYATKFSYPNEAIKMTLIYKDLLSK